ncbi:hypothetical protein IVB12_05360 [Bradyrhizobium sp. 179]|nr:hypothetical protein [Bradyrhizobium sp. 179]MCK1541419.1 hypothetical protein [Bradyrhizobium sp. 179]
MADNHTIKAPCPVCGSKTTKPAIWFRTVRSLVRYIVVFANLNHRR